MTKLIEVGTGRSRAADARLAGREAAAGALSHVRQFAPCLTLVFASSVYEAAGVADGVASVVGPCPTLGTSSAGEVWHDLGDSSVVVTVLASPHMVVEVGVGEGVESDWERAARDALPGGQASAFLRDGRRPGRPNYLSSPVLGLAPVFVLLITPGPTVGRPSRSHEIHGYLKRLTVGRVPFVGGSSSSSNPALETFQLANGRDYRDAVAMAVVETDLVFGVGTSHGFRPTRKRAVVTRVEGHVVRRLDDRPALEVCADLVGVEAEELLRDSGWFSRSPFGTTDDFGHHHLLVPERALAEGSIRFAPVMDGLESITLMEVDHDTQRQAAGEAFRKAVDVGMIHDPAAVLLFAGLLGASTEEASADAERQGIRAVATRASTSGFLTPCEFGVTDEGSPICCNQSVVALVLGNRLDASAIAMRRRANALQEIERRLDRKTAELVALRRANEVAIDRSTLATSLRELEGIMTDVTGATSATFALAVGLDSGGARRGAPPSSALPPAQAAQPPDPRRLILPLVSMGQQLGYVELEGEADLQSVETARSICEIAARSLHGLMKEETISEQAREIATLHAIGREVVLASDYRAAMLEIAGHICRHLGASGFSLWLSQDDDSLSCEANTIDSPVSSTLAIATGAVNSKKLHVEADVDPAKVAAPLIFSDRVVGALVLAFPQDTGVPSDFRFLVHLRTPLSATAEIYMRQREWNVAREIHHRVKNNLQIIASLLSLQLRRLTDPAAKEALDTSIKRIMSIAVVHEALSEKHTGQVDAVALVKTIAEFIIQGAVDSYRPVRVSYFGVPSLMLSSHQATNLAVVANEFVGNALKHGLRENSGGHIEVGLEAVDGVVQLTVRDDGEGLPEGFSVDRDQGLGLQLISTIAQNEFAGRFELNRLPLGVEACLIFPLDRFLLGGDPR